MTRISRITHFGVTGNAFIYIDGNPSESARGAGVEIVSCTSANQTTASLGGLNQYGIYVQGVEDLSIRNSIINGHGVDFNIDSVSGVGNNQSTWGVLIDSCHSEDFRPQAQDHPAWAASTSQSVSYANCVTPSVPNGYLYHPTVAGTTGTTEPTWPTTLNATVTDGTVTWQCFSYQTQRWAAATVIGTNFLGKPTKINANGWIYQATTGGTTGTTEPAWPTGYGSTVTDGTVVWTVVDRSVNVLVNGTYSGTSVKIVNSAIGLGIVAYQQNCGLLSIEGTQALSASAGLGYSDYSYQWIGSSSIGYFSAKDSSLFGNFKPYVTAITDTYTSKTTFEHVFFNHDTIGFVANNTRSGISFNDTLTVGNGVTIQALPQATSGQNYNSPLLNLKTSYYNGSGPAQGGFQINVIEGTGTNPIEALTFTHAGSPGGSTLVYQGFQIDGASDVTLSNTNTATSGTNYNSPYIKLLSNYWTGSASGTNYWTIQGIAGVGSEPSETLTISQSGSTGTAAVSFGALPLTTGLINGQTISSSANFTGSVTVGSGVINLTGNAYPQITFANTTNSQTYRFEYASSQTGLAIYDSTANAYRLVIADSTGIATFGSSVYATEFFGSGAGLTSIPNASLTNSSITIGSTSISLGSTVTSLAGLTSVAATTFTGALTGNASTSTSATTATNIAGGAAGSIPYNTGAGATAFLAPVNGQILQSGTSAPAWTPASGLSVGTATNIAGGAAGSIPYQTAAGITALLATAAGVLVGGGTTPAYSTAPTLTGTNFSAIPNAALTNSSVTVTAGTGMSGGGAVSLGGSVTLTNAGVTSVVAGTDTSVSSATGAVTINNTSTLATVTGRGASTATAVSITNATAATSTATGALTVSGGVGVAGTVFAGNITIAALGTATSGANYNSGNLVITSSYYNGSGAATDTLTLVGTPGTGANPIVNYAFNHSGSSGGSSFSFVGGNFAFGGNGIFSKYGSVAVVGNGVPGEVNQIKSSGLTSNYNAGAAKYLYTPTAASILRISYAQMLTTVDPVSSTCPSLTLSWTDVGGVARTKVLVATSTANTTAVESDGTCIIYTNTSTGVTVTSTGYVSNTAAMMQYALTVTTEIL